MNRKKQTVKLGFLASYRGTNMQAIIDACKSGQLAARPAVVISNNGNSGALDRAEEEKIPAYHLSSSNFPDPADLDQKISATLTKHAVDLVILAGYMKKIGAITLEKFAGRILNVHPALLPKFGGKGMYGMHVHEAVIAAGETETGVSIHLVNENYDEGTVLAQKKISINAGDTAESLAQRVLKVEHKLYVETIDRIIKGEIELPFRM